MRNFLGRSKQTQAVYSFVIVDFYCFCYVSLSFLQDSKFSGEFYGKVFLRSKSHYLKFRGELTFHGELISYYIRSRQKQTYVTIALLHLDHNFL